jgi:hypothetical protein
MFAAKEGRHDSAGQCSRFAAVLIASASLVLSPACSRPGSGRVPTHPVKGSITYQGNSLGGALVVLHPKGDTNANVPTATAQVKADGSFSLSTYDAGDGAPAGDYVVTVQWYKPVRMQEEVVPGPNQLPRKYSDPSTSDLVVHVAEGSNDLPPITLRR